MNFPYAPRSLARPPHSRSCFGREHGRNKGEFNSLDDRLRIIITGVINAVAAPVEVPEFGLTPCEKELSRTAARMPKPLEHDSEKWIAVFQKNHAQIIMPK